MTVGAAEALGHSKRSRYSEDYDPSSSQPGLLSPATTPQPSHRKSTINMSAHCNIYLVYLERSAHLINVATVDFHTCQVSGHLPVEVVTLGNKLNRPRGTGVVVVSFSLPRLNLIHQLEPTLMDTVRKDLLVLAWNNSPMRVGEK